MSATSAAGSGGVAPSSLSPWRVATIFSPSRSMKMPDTEIDPPSTRSTPDVSTLSLASASRKRRLAVVGAERSGEPRGSAEPRHCDRGIGGAAAGGRDQIGRARLLARARESGRP